VTRRPILLVEDSQDDEELAVLALRETGLEVTIDVARDGEEAIRYLFDRDDGALPACVFLDVKLPKLDGFEVLRRIRESPRTRFLPVVVLTSSDVPEDIARAYELGANSYVRKPVEFSEFSDTVQQVGRYWLRLNQTRAPRRN
jgi:two-component system response regulator